jgi:hypothetical protein
MNRSLLKLVKSWQKAIVADLSAQYPHLSAAQHDWITQSVIISVLTADLCETQTILPVGSLRSLMETRSISEQLSQLWYKLPDVGLHWQQGLTIAPVSDACLRHLIRSLSLKDVAVSIVNLGQVYECLLTNTRKASGSYYTPSAIVAYILQNTLIRQLTETSVPLKLLDPACGGGVFLLSAYQLLLDWYLKKYLQCSTIWSQPIQQNDSGEWCLTLEERSRILHDHIYGIDIDPNAVAITKLGLELQRLAGTLTRSPSNLSQNIICDNTLFRQVHEACFDVVVGNPPYLDSEWMTTHLPDWRSYCVAQYQTAIGNWDLFCVFIEKALMLCKPGGFTSLVVPNKLAAADYAAAARSLLTQKATLLALRDYSKTSAFSASVYPLVYVAQKKQSDTRSNIQINAQSDAQFDAQFDAQLDTSLDANYQTVWYERMSHLEQVEAAYPLKVPAAAASQSPWLLTQHPQQVELISRLSQFPQLASIAQITGAATVAEAYAMQPWIQDSALTDGIPLVNSGTIDRYRLLWGEKPMRYLGQSYRYPIIPIAAIEQLPPQRYQQATQPKIIVAGMTRSLECALDAAGKIWAGKSTTLIRAIDPALDLRYLLGILNSRLIQVYFASHFAGNQLQGGYLRVGAPQLRKLPVPEDLNLCRANRLIELVDQQLRLDRPNAAIDAAIDQLVYQLYGLTEPEIETVQRS